MLQIYLLIPPSNKKLNMKNKYSRNLINASLVAVALASGAANAGTEPMAPAPMAPPPVEDVVSGVLKLDFNTHFISYGADVWSDRDPQLSELNFNPMLELAIAMPANLTATLGVWADVTDKGVGSTIGGDIREIDIWAGLAYTYDKFTVGATFQEWYYGSSSEEILDIKFSYDTFLSPSLTVHNRLGEGASGGDEGTVLVAGISYGFEAGPVSISFPVNLAYFVTDEFHGVGVADSGFGFVSFGVGASVPLEFLSPVGDWTLNAGLTYYITDEEVIPNNDTGDFLTASLGVALAF